MKWFNKSEANEALPPCGREQSRTPRAAQAAPASLAGLAPHPHQSGESHWKRRMARGRQEIKKMMFLAALSACRHNPSFKQIYERLLVNGKAKKVAIFAVARQILTHLNHMVAKILPTAALSGEMTGAAWAVRGACHSVRALHRPSPRRLNLA